MKEQDLIDLGFERNDVSEKESGDKAFYYYDLDLAPGFALISNANDEVTTVAGHHRWYVEIFESNEVRFTNKKDTQQFINLILKNKK